MRRKHGFELDSVECPAGCGGTRKSQRRVSGKGHPWRPEIERESKHRGRAQTFTDEQLREALTGAASIREVMKRLGVTFSAVYLRAKAKPALWALYQKAKATSGGARNQHPGFKDLTGQRFGVLEVVERAPNAGSGNARWLVRCTTCEGTEIYEGIQLRSMKNPKACRSCRSAA